MGDVRRVLITGASGFIGDATVKAALDAGLEVVAAQRAPGADRTGVSYVSVDLTVQEAVPALVDALAGCDAVIHLAAAMSGDPDAHKRLTLAGTERVIAAMHQAGVGHLTLASSIAVYDTSQVPVGGVLTDACPLESPGMSRDAYSDAKVRQERLARQARLDSVAILRPGIVYDSSRLWNAHLGIGLGPVLFRIGDDDPLPMCHVDRCAAALVQATLGRVDGSFAVLDKTLPTRGAVIAALRRSGWPKVVVPFPVQVLNALARICRPISSRLPGLLRESVLRQRAMPMLYDLDPAPGSDDWPDPAPPWGDAA